MPSQSMPDQSGVPDNRSPLPPSYGPEPGEQLGFLLVGHGTRNLKGQEQLRSVFADFAALLAPRRAALAFLELAEPDIPSAVAELAAMGVTSLITIPVLLFSAGHAQQDIPAAVSAAAEKLGLRSSCQVPPLECCQPMLDLSAQRFREAVCGRDCLGSQSAGVGVNGCSGQTCPQVGLVMIGRGSSSAPATDQMRRFTRLRLEQTPVRWHETAFIHAQSPNVQRGLDELAASDVSLAVVQPHLLFEGELMDNLRLEVARRQELQPHKRWVLTQTLGTDASLARTLAQVALNAAHRI